jgi:hypothetical protein
MIGYSAKLGRPEKTPLFGVVLSACASREGDDSANSIQANPSKRKQMQTKLLEFACFYFSESGLFNGLHRIQIRNLDLVSDSMRNVSTLSLSFSHPCVHPRLDSAHAKLIPQNSDYRNPLCVVAILTSDSASGSTNGFTEIERKEMQTQHNKIRLSPVDIREAMSQLGGKRPLVGRQLSSASVSFVAPIGRKVAAHLRRWVVGVFGQSA